jgi:hypothetical protein
MGGHPFPEISCNICSNPVDLTVDLSADERGSCVHENCYVNRLIAARNRAAVENLFDALSVEAGTRYCSGCGSLLSHMSTTFLSQTGKVWEIPLPICEACNARVSFPAAYVDA